MQELAMQVFMMPGAIFINVLAGSLYGLWGPFIVIAGVSTLGASLNYWLSRLVVKVSLIACSNSCSCMVVAGCLLLQERFAH